MIMHVTIGKYRVNFSFLTRISPGRRPNQGILGEISSKIPVSVIPTPNIMRNLGMLDIVFFIG